MAEKSARRAPVRRRADSGAVSTIVAVLFAGGVVLGMLAISVDVGAMMWERRQVQNGADAGAMALAKICGANPVDCDPAKTPNGLGAKSLQGLLDANANDGSTALAPSGGGLTNGQCGRAAGVNMPNCPTTGNAAEIQACTPLPDWLAANAAIPYVEVNTLTQGVGGPSLFTPFADAINGGPRNIRIPACARAAWGAPATYTAKAPLALSVCEWNQNTSSGTSWVANGPVGANPGYGPWNPWPDASKERVILLHDTTKSDNCAYKGKDTDGGFGYLDISGACTITVNSADPWARIDTGNSAPSGCSDVFRNLRGTSVALPVFDCLIKSGSMPAGAPSPSTDCSGAAASGANSWYHIKGWASFYVSGYKISGSDAAPSYRTGSIPCSGSQRCVSGWFLKGELQADSITAPGSDSDLGSFAVLPAG